MVAGLLSPSKPSGNWSRLLIAGALCLFFSFPLFAQSDVDSVDQRYVVDIELQSANEFYDLLSRAQQLLLEGAALTSDGAKVSFVLHGPVLRKLDRNDYLANKELVDLAASLSAMNIIEVKACRAWMRHNGMDEAQLLPFVETVPYGPGAVKAMLESDSYTRF